MHLPLKAPDFGGGNDRWPRSRTKTKPGPPRRRQDSPAGPGIGSSNCGPGPPGPLPRHSPSCTRPRPDGPASPFQPRFGLFRARRTNCSPPLPDLGHGTSSAITPRQPRWRRRALPLLEAPGNPPAPEPPKTAPAPAAPERSPPDRGPSPAPAIPPAASGTQACRRSATAGAATAPASCCACQVPLARRKATTCSASITRTSPS